MKSLRIMFLCLMQFLIVGENTFSASPLPVKPNNYVVDKGNLLSDKVEDIINEKAKQLQLDKGIALFVITLDSTNGENIESYTEDVFNQWNIGGENRNGVLFITAFEDKAVRIMYGNGLSETYSDNQLKTLINEKITPLYKEGKYEEGVLTGFQELSTIPLISQEQPSKSSFQITEEIRKDAIQVIKIGMWFSIAGVLIFVGLLAFIVLRERYETKKRNKRQIEEYQELIEKRYLEQKKEQLGLRKIDIHTSFCHSPIGKSSSPPENLTTAKTSSSDNRSTPSSNPSRSYQTSYYDSPSYTSDNSSGGDGGASGSW